MKAIHYLKHAAEHMERQLAELELKMIEAEVVSPIALQRRGRMAAAIEALRQEIVRLEMGRDFVVGPDMLKMQGSSFPFLMTQPEDES